MTEPVSGRERSGWTLTEIVVGEWRRMVVNLVRYPLETISSMVTMFLVFAGLFYGATYITQSPIGSGRLAGVVLGYAVWILMMAATGDMGWSIQNEAQNGTLEQVMLLPWPSVVVFLVRALMAIVGFLLPMLVVVAGLLYITGVEFSWRLSALLPMMMTLTTAWGLGLIVAAIALVFKRIGQVLNMIQFLLLFVIMIPMASHQGMLWHLMGMVVPFAAEVSLLHQLLGSSGATTGWLWVDSLVNTALFMGLGVWLFWQSDRLSRTRGILGHY